MLQLASYPKVNLEDYSVYEIADATFDYKFETIKYMTQLRAAGMWNQLDELLKAYGCNCTWIDSAAIGMMFGN